MNDLEEPEKKNDTTPLISKKNNAEFRNRLLSNPDNNPSDNKTIYSTFLVSLKDYFNSEAEDELATSSVDKNQQWSLLLRISAISVFHINFGAVVALFAMIILPFEASRLFPGEEATMLSLMIFTIALTQLVCPYVGTMSDNSLV